jgi:hypothetical protein
MYNIIKEEAMPAAGREGLWGCKMSRIPNFLDQWYSTFFVHVTLDTIYLELCTQKVVCA